MSQIVSELGPPKAWAVQAWVDCLRWASSDGDIVQRFCTDTGTTVESASKDDAVLGVEFIKWFNANVWGEINGRACNGDED